MGGEKRSVEPECLVLFGFPTLSLYENGLREGRQKVQAGQNLWRLTLL